MSKLEQQNVVSIGGLPGARDEVLPLKEIPKQQLYGDDPTKVRDTSHYQAEYVENFVERWDQLIDWDARA